MSSSLPLVSIITGYYNRKDNLLESIQSVLDQDYPNFEYIVFDDCSTDGTFELLQQFKGNPLLTIIRNETNMGLTKGLIHAISRSKGKYIAIHGAGDISFKERIKEQVGLLENNSEIGIVGCVLEDVYDGETHLFSPVRDDGQFYFSHGEVMYRKSLYYKVGGYNALFKYGQFTMLKWDMMKLAKASYVDKVLYRRIHFNNGVTRNDKKKIEQVISYTIGKNASNKGFLNIDMSAIIIYVSFQHIHILKPKTEDERRFMNHAYNKGFHYVLLYYLFRIKIIPSFLLSKFGSLMRKIKRI